MANEPTVRQRRLGAELRRLREESKVSAEQVAARLDCHISKISRIELGQSPTRRLDLEAMLDLYGVTDEHRRPALLKLARSAKTKGWWQSYTDVIPPAYADFIGLEADAARIDSFETMLVPGLLQTPDYARAVITEAWETEGPEQVERLVEVRRLRQELLDREEPFELKAIICESALRQCIGSTETMRAQLQHLVEVERRPNVTLQVLPYSAGAHPGLNGPFTVLGFAQDGDADVVLTENLASSLYFEDKRELHRFQWAFDRLTAIAASPRASVSLLKTAIKELT
ncbi:helix-turn-helix transcriptional regulator [Streptomyces sp. NPDC003077]|uniref:helix-turn-helix domain-containing protein n=1 Tax=Streptomyces sp. NPDC003077 TaxID=3154443 RepID=UPI0033BF5903